MRMASLITLMPDAVGPALSSFITLTTLVARFVVFPTVSCWS